MALSWPQRVRLLDEAHIDKFEFSEHFTPSEFMLNLEKQMVIYCLSEGNLEQACNNVFGRRVTAPPVVNVLEPVASPSGGASPKIVTPSEDDSAGVASNRALGKTPSYDVGKPTGISTKDDSCREPTSTMIYPEAVLGSRASFLEMSFFTKGIRTSRVVCKIEVSLNGKKNVGTGFLISESHLLTNNHVIPTEDAARNAECFFNFEDDEEGWPKRTFSYCAPKTDKLFFESDSRLDWTVIKLEGRPGYKWGYTELCDYIPAINDSANIVGHPNGDKKKISMSNNRIAYIDEGTIKYFTDTEGGSSGSPVFNDNWQVIALHRGACKNGGVPFNFGCPAHIIRKALLKFNILPPQS